MSSITALTSDNFSTALNGETGLAVIYFSASWCQPCQNMTPVFFELARQVVTAGVTFGTVDMAESPTIAQTYGIRSVPSIAVFRQGRLTVLIAGEVALDDVMCRVQKALGSQS